MSRGRSFQRLCFSPMAVDVSGLPTMRYDLHRHWEAYKAVLPSKQHCAVGKETGLTCYIERFNNTLRQRVSRLVRQTLSFSKKLDNHVSAIWNFIHYYNEQISLEQAGC